MATWHDDYVDVASGVNLHVKIRTTSTESTLPTLLFLHFWGGSNATWDAVATAIDERINLVIPSMRGWGQSSRDLGSGAYRSIDYANDVLALVHILNQLRPELRLIERGIVFVGHSLGGKIALRVTATAIDDHDNADSSWLRGILLVAPSPASGFDFSAELLARMRVAFETPEVASSVVRTAMLGVAAARDDELVSRLVHDAMHGAREAVVAFPDYGAKEAFQDELIKAVERRTRDQCPLHILVVEGDEKLEDADIHTARVLDAAGAQVEYARLPCGHLIPVEVPARLAEMAENFLGGLGLAAVIAS